MDCATGAVSAQRRKSKGFGNNALSGKGRVTMQQNAQNLGPINIILLLLLGPNTPHNDRINNLQMRWIWREAQMHFFTVKFTVSRSAHVIFHIT